MKRIFLRAILLAAATVAGGSPLRALCPTNVTATVGDRTVDFGFQTDTPGASTGFRIRFGLVPDEMEFLSRLYTAPSGSAGATSRHIPLTGLAPSTTYYFEPQVSTPNLTEWSGAASCQAELCPTLGAQPGGYFCEDVGGGLHLPRLTTLPLDSPAAREPAPPVHDFDPRAVPPVNGSTFEVAVDEDGLCTNLQAQLNACAAANPALNHQIRIPPGAICRPESEGLVSYTLPAKFGAGDCIVRSGADPLLLPPPGVRIDPSYRRHMAEIQGNRFDVRTFHSRLLTDTDCAAPPCTEGWRFEGLYFTMPAFEQMPRHRWSIVSVDPSNGTIVLDSPHGLPANAIAQVNAPGIHARGLHEACTLVSVQADRFRCQGYTSNVGGAYEGGGTVTMALAVPLAGCAAGSPAVCETAEPHGFGNYHRFPLTRIAAGEATTATPHTIPSSRAVKIEGTPGGVWDGVYRLTAANLAAGTLRPAGLPAGDCDPCTGTVRQIGSIVVFGARGAGADAVNGVHALTVVDPTHVLLENSSLVEPVEGGSISYDPPRMNIRIALRETRRAVFDRCVIDNRGFPYRAWIVFQWSTKQPGFRTASAVIDSWHREANAWFPVNPATGVALDSGQNAFATKGLVHLHSTTSDLQLLNNVFESNAGIQVFADNSNYIPADLTFERNHFWTPERLIGGHPAARGLYYGSRHFQELKGGVRAAMRGSFFRGNAANSQNTGSPIQVKTTGLPGSLQNTLRDVVIEHNTLLDNGGTIDILAEVDYTQFVESVQRVRIAENLIVGTDFVRWRATPAGQSGEMRNGWLLSSSPFSGRVLTNISAHEDIEFSRNTVLPVLGNGPFMLFLGGEASGGSRMWKNVLPFSQAIVPPGIRTEASALTYAPPPPATTGFGLWLGHYRQGPGIPDPLASWDNAVLPCTNIADNQEVSNVDNHRWRSWFNVNNAKSLAESRLACNGPCPANFVNLFASTDGKHCYDREQEMFGASLDYKLPPGSPFSGYGADLDQLRAAQGRVVDVKATRTSNSATISYLAPDAAACWVDVGTDKFFATPAHVRLSDGGGPVSRSVAVSGLLPETVYHYRVLCQVDQPRGAFSTLPGGPL